MLSKLYHYLFDKRTLPITSQDDDDNQSSVHSVTLVLHSESVIDIVMTHPDLNRLSNDDIVIEAEKFAELLVYMSNNIMESKLLKTISKKGQQSSNIKEQLFYDNVITFYKLIQSELEQKISYNGPLIRPTAAFNIR